VRNDSTIYDVAREAGVSIATVSRVMNHPERVAPVTRSRILSVMTRLGFSPTSEAVARARLGLKRVGVVAPFAWSYSFVQRIRGLSKHLSPREYEITTYSVENRGQLDSVFAMLSAGDRVDGVVVMALPLDKEALMLFRRRGMPLVSLETRIEYVCSILSDNQEGGRIAAEYLLRKGYRHPAFLGEGGHPDYVVDSARSRFQAFSERLGAGEIEMEKEHICFHYAGADYARGAARKLISGKFLPEVVFAASDYDALILYRIARNAGLQVPGDLAILGYDNIEAAEFIGLSTIDQQLDESGRLAAKMIELAFRGSFGQIPEVIRLPVTLIERDTA